MPLSVRITDSVQDIRASLALSAASTVGICWPVYVVITSNAFGYATVHSHAITQITFY